MYMPGWRRESKPLCVLHESINSYEYISHFIRLPHHVQTDTSASVFLFVYNIVIFYSLFRGTSLFVHTLAVMSQFVQWGMMCCWEWISSFFRLNYWYNRIFKLFINIPHFIIFQLHLKIGFALLFFRWLEVWLHILMNFIVGNIYVSGFQQAWK